MMASVLGVLAWLYSDKGEVEEAKIMCREAVAIHREVGDLIGVAAVLTTLGKVHGDLGEWEEAEAAYREALTICRQSGHLVGLAQALTGLFTTCYRRGDLDKAADFARQSIAANREVGDRLGMAIAYHNLGFLAAGAGRHNEAAAYYRQALNIYQAINADGTRRSNSHRYLAESLLALGEIAAAGEHIYDALHLLPVGATPQRVAELLLTCALWLIRRNEEALATGIVACLQENGRLPEAVNPELSALLAREPAAVTFHSMDEGLAAVRHYSSKSS
jgi:tetratricopeptide (TPR) repeat protein